MSTTGSLIRYTIYGDPEVYSRCTDAIETDNDEFDFTEIGDGTTREWSLQRPYGSSAVLEGDLSGPGPIYFYPDVEGSYAISCKVDGGLTPQDISTTIIASRIQRQSFSRGVIGGYPYDLASVRIPVLGEKTEFDRDPIILGGADNSKGYVRELGLWYNQVANYGFGTVLGDSFYRMDDNFVEEYVAPTYHLSFVGASLLSSNPSTGLVVFSTSLPSGLSYGLPVIKVAEASVPPGPGEHPRMTVVGSTGHFYILNSTSQMELCEEAALDGHLAIIKGTGGTIIDPEVDMLNPARMVQEGSTGWTTMTHRFKDDNVPDWTATVSIGNKLVVYYGALPAWSDPLAFEAYEIRNVTATELYLTSEIPGEQNDLNYRIYVAPEYNRTTLSPSGGVIESLCWSGADGCWVNFPIGGHYRNIDS
jgi:hypothetical protein